MQSTRIGTWVLASLIVSSLALNIDRSHASLEQMPAAVPFKELVYDFGFFNGADSLFYLSQGFRVVAIEADPTLAAAGQTNLALLPFIQTNQLQILNRAVAPLNQDVESWLPFYLNKCSKEWNSFYSKVGCRSCLAPYLEDQTKSTCTPSNVVATPCASILAQNGVGKYMKLDIEGAEEGCYHAMKQNPLSSPAFISAEVVDANLVDTLVGLGYKSFKLVKQKGGISGEWGDQALDCKTGTVWRSMQGAKQTLQAVFGATSAPNDPCPSLAIGGSWYDLHASKAVHQTW